MTTSRLSKSDDLARLRRVIERIVPRPRRRHVDILFTDDRTIAELSGRYRGRAHATDVLAFVYGADCNPIADIVISVQTARRQARQRRVPLDQELLLLMLHGLLHVGGQGDETWRDWCDMRRLEFEGMMRVL